MSDLPLLDKAQLALGDLAVVLAQFEVNPDSGAPGAGGIQEAINAVAFWMLLACTAGFVLSAGVWAIAGRIGNDHHSQLGKIGMVIALGGVFFIGAAPVLLRFAYNLVNG